MIDKIIEYISIFLALIIVLPLHEFAHAFVAVKSGDITPKLYKRYTLNPLAHFDPLGLVCFVFAGFGWAKPVPINPNNFKRYKLDYFLVSVAGVTVNYLLAFIAYPILILLAQLFYGNGLDLGYFDDVIFQSVLYVYSMSISFFVFNLIPVYPLDGFRVIDAISKKRSGIYWFLRKYGQYVLLALFALSIVSDITGIYQLDILGIVINAVAGIISVPITAFWGLIF